MEEIKEDINKWKHSQWSSMEKLKLLKFPENPSDVECNPYQNTNGIPYRNRKIAISKFL
jgi:hypothetical protein